MTIEYDCKLINKRTRHLFIAEFLALKDQWYGDTEGADPSKEFYEPGSVLFCTAGSWHAHYFNQPDKDRKSYAGLGFRQYHPTGPYRITALEDGSEMVCIGRLDKGHCGRESIVLKAGEIYKSKEIDKVEYLYIAKGVVTINNKAVLRKGEIARADEEKNFEIKAIEDSWIAYIVIE